MPPEQQGNVWVSKEEYERLRQAQQEHVQLLANQTYAADEPAKVKPIQITVGIILAVGLFLSMTVPILNFISVPILGVLLIFAAMSINDFRRSKDQVNNAVQPSSVHTSAVANQAKGSGKYRVLLIVLLCILASPVAFIGLMLVLLVLAFAGGGGQSS